MLDKQAFFMGYNNYKQEMIKKADTISSYNPDTKQWSNQEQITPESVNPDKYAHLFSDYNPKIQPIVKEPAQDIISNKDIAWRDIRNKANKVNNYDFAEDGKIMREQMAKRKSTNGIPDLGVQFGNPNMLKQIFGR